MVAECKNREGIQPLATVPLQSGKHAAAVLEEAVKMGMPGAMIGTQPNGDMEISMTGLRSILGDGSEVTRSNYNTSNVWFR